MPHYSVDIIQMLANENKNVCIAVLSTFPAFHFHIFSQDSFVTPSSGMEFHLPVTAAHPPTYDHSTEEAKSESWPNIDVNVRPAAPAV